MCSRHLGFLFFLWFPGVLHAQNARTSCRAPILEGGVFAPHKVFYPHGQTLVYNCENGRTTEEGGWWASVTCVDGIWSHMPRCKRGGAGPGTGHSGSTTSADIGTQSEVSFCGAYPVVPNGVVVDVTKMFLKYQCSNFYTLVGSNIVTCHSNGQWSHQPICKDAYCVLDPSGSKLSMSGIDYLHEGETRFIPCIWHLYSSAVQCKDGKITLSNCCLGVSHSLGTC